MFGKLNLFKRKSAQDEPKADPIETALLEHLRTSGLVGQLAAEIDQKRAAQHAEKCSDLAATLQASEAAGRDHAARVAAVEAKADQTREAWEAALCEVGLAQRARFDDLFQLEHKRDRLLVEVAALADPRIADARQFVNEQRDALFRVRDVASFVIGYNGAALPVTRLGSCAAWVASRRDVLDGLAQRLSALTLRAVSDLDAQLAEIRTAAEPGRPEWRYLADRRFDDEGGLIDDAVDRAYRAESDAAMPPRPVTA